MSNRHTWANGKIHESASKGCISALQCCHQSTGKSHACSWNKTYASPASQKRRSTNCGASRKNAAAIHFGRKIYVTLSRIRQLTSPSGPVGLCGMQGQI